MHASQSLTLSTLDSHSVYPVMSQQNRKKTKQNTICWLPGKAGEALALLNTATSIPTPRSSQYNSSTTCNNVFVFTLSVYCLLLIQVKRYLYISFLPWHSWFFFPPSFPQSPSLNFPPSKDFTFFKSSFKFTTKLRGSYPIDPPTHTC